MKINSDNTIHARTVNMTLEWGDLKKMIVNYAAAQKGLNADGVTASVTIKQRTEGSPDYSIAQWEAHVTLVEDLSRRPMPKDDA